MKNELVKAGDFKVIEIEFLGDYILVVQHVKQNKTYVGLKPIYMGIGMTEGQWQSFTRKVQEDTILMRGIANLQLPTKGGNQQSLCMELEYLPLFLAKISITPNMIKNKSEVVEKLVEYQMKAKDVLAQVFLKKKEDWNLQREVSKIDRKRMTSSIQTYIPNAKHFTYANYTDMVYRILFNMTAKQIRESRNINKKSDLTRDYLTEKELKLVDEAETIVTALTALGFKYDYVKHQLVVKYGNKILSDGNNKVLLN